MVANSVWGHPEALKLSWYATALGLANEAAAHNDGLMSLDEIGQSTKPKDVATAAYALFNGVGKIQGAKDGGNREAMRWRVLALSKIWKPFCMKPVRKHMRGIWFGY